MAEIPKMRTINAAYQWIIEQDSQTCLTRNAFRGMVVRGRIPSIKVGNRFLVNVDKVFPILEKELRIESHE